MQNKIEIKEAINMPSDGQYYKRVETGTVYIWSEDTLISLKDGIPWSRQNGFDECEKEFALIPKEAKIEITVG